VTWAATIYTEWGWRNLIRWQSIAAHELHTPNREVHRLLTRLSVDNLFHPFATFIYGQKALAPRIAKLHKIPLVLFGESESEYGNPKEKATRPERERSFHEASEHMALGGVPVTELLERYRLSRADISAYLPVEDASGVDVRYLGYYLRWKPQESYYYAVEHGGFEVSPDRQPGTWSKYSGLDDQMDDLHFWTSYQKFGIGRATYDAAQEIRSGDITRDEAVALVRRFDGEFPERFLDEVNAYLSVDGFEPMTRARWWTLAEKFRSPHLWKNGELIHRV
jgi:hypothetical protein